MQNHNHIYNNADSFAMVFDEAWKQTDFKTEESLTIDQKIQIILEALKDHPFVKESPLKAISVAKFRLKLLGLK